MNIKVVIIFHFFCVGLSFAVNVPALPSECPANEEFLECGNACPATCNHKPEICPAICVSGCFCKKGYVRKVKGGQCIPEKSCEDVCPVNEEYLECGTACPATCNYKPEVCTANCVSGCFCKKGYVRKVTGGQCIPEKSCEDLCPVNEEYSECGPASPATCHHKPDRCPDNCVRGCFCKKGYVRLLPGYPCIPEKSCENYPRCTENEVFSNCSTLCPRTCNNDELRICPLLCLFGCVCKPGFVREKLNGKCIPEVSCRNVCSKDRVYSDCGSACPGTCSEPVKACVKKCVKGCFCKEGYVIQDDTKKCVKLEDCPCRFNKT